MPPRPKKTLLLIMVFGWTVTAPAVHRSNPGENQAEPSAETVATQNQKRMFLLLDHLLETSRGFSDPHLQLEIQTRIADLLWSRDERRARQLFYEAFQRVNEMKLAHLEEDDSMRPLVAGIKSQLRTEILRMISRRDQALAEKLASAVKQTPAGKPEQPGCTGCRNQNESETQLLKLAMTTVGSEPARAMQLAKAGLDKGINPMIASVLRVMRDKDPALGDELFVYALSVARRDSIYLSDSFRSLFSYALPELGSSLIMHGGSHPLATTPANPATVSAFLDFVHDAIEREASALQVGGANADPQHQRRIAFDYFVGEQTLPYFDLHKPEKTATVRARLNDILGMVPPEAARQYLADFKNERSPGASLNEAKTETNAARQQSLYQQAINQALNSRDYDQALALLPKLDEEVARSYFKSRIRHQRAVAAMNDLNVAYEYANEVPNMSMRALLLGQIALQLFYAKDTQRAARILAEAEDLFQITENGADKARGMVELVYAAAQIDLGRGFEDMRLAVEAINSAGFTPHWISFRPLPGEKRKTFILTDVGASALRFDMGFERLARSDSGRALQLAQMIALKEVSVLAQLAVCRIAIDQMPAFKPTDKAKAKDNRRAR
ncbi:MAG: hypothetical protein WAU45_04290 [Blastocatellia bacterium]